MKLCKDICVAPRMNPKNFFWSTDFSGATLGTDPERTGGDESISFSTKHENKCCSAQSVSMRSVDLWHRLVNDVTE